MWLLDKSLYNNTQTGLQEKFQLFLIDYASKIDRDTKKVREYVPRQGNFEHNYGIEFPGFSIQNMLDMKIEDVEECHRFLILELRNSEGKFSLKFGHQEEKFSSYCSKCGLNKICQMDPETNSPYCSDICLKKF